ncbi:MAG: pyridoxal 5'-phosphate synthase lyase subunit PdxS [archaeon]
MKLTKRMKVNYGLAQMLKGGVIMDVTSAAQARIAEKAGAVAVMALERVPADIRKQGGIARMADPVRIKEIMASVTIPVMAKVRIGHFAEAQILQELGVDFIDESEVLTPADSRYHIAKLAFDVPFVCGATCLGEALRRIKEGASMIRTKGEAGTGNIIEAVRHIRVINEEIALLKTNKKLQKSFSIKERVPLDLVKEVAKNQRLPVVNFAAGGIATPADASLVMQLGVEGVFVGSGVFKSSDPDKRAAAIVEATTNFKNSKILARVSFCLGEPMQGIDIKDLDIKYAERGW